jgi:hypothetical protein
MVLNPPAGSKISIVSEGGDSTIVIPQPNNLMRYPTGLFLLFWLGGWAFGFSHAVGEVMSGRANAFLVFWLGGWTIGGCFAALAAYRSFRPSIPEMLTLKRGSVDYDSGIAPPQFNSRGSSKSVRDVWTSAFPKRVRADLDRRQLQSLRLRETDTGNRLTVDIGNDRVEIAAGASEVEREWLADLLTRHYSLPQVAGNQAAAKPDPSV